MRSDPQFVLALPHFLISSLCAPRLMLMNALGQGLTPKRYATRGNI